MIIIVYNVVLGIIIVISENTCTTNAEMGDSASFAPKVNSAYARHTFRQLQQNANETVSQFGSLLKRYAKDCDYGTDTDNQIRDEIHQKCKSDYLRRKLLEEGLGLTLAQTLELAQQCEKVEAQMASLSLHSTQPNTTAAMTTRSTELPQLPTVVISVLGICVGPA